MRHEANRVSVRATTQWRRWSSWRRAGKNQKLLATGSGSWTISASLTTLDRDALASGWPGGSDFFSEESEVLAGREQARQDRLTALARMWG